MTKKVYGWHFLPKSRRLRYGDGRKAVPGETLRYTGALPIEPCRRGLHASERIGDALLYATGPVLCRVYLSGEVVLHSGGYTAHADKMVATRRTVLWMCDIEPALREYSGSPQHSNPVTWAARSFCVRRSTHLSRRFPTWEDQFFSSNEAWMKEYKEVVQKLNDELELLVFRFLDKKGKVCR